MSAQACLTAWNDPIGRPNWWRTRGVGHRGGQHGLGQSDAVAGDGHRRPIQQATHSRFGIAVEPPHRDLVHHYTVRDYHRQSTCLVDHWLWGHRESGCLRSGDDDHRHVRGVRE